MRPQDIKIGSIYRLKSNPNYSYFRADEIIDPRTGVNTHGYKIVKGEHSVDVRSIPKFSYTRYFRPADLVKEKEDD